MAAAARASRLWVALLTLVCGVATAPVAAQAPDPHAVQPERPSVATHAFTVAPGWVELEFGGARETDHGAYLDTILPLNVKLGVRPGVQLAVSTTPYRPAGARRFSDDAFSVGVKWRVAEGTRFGTLAVLPSAELPTSSARGSGAAGLLFIASETLGGLSLDLNLGHTRKVGGDDEDWTSETLWAVSAGGPLRGAVAWGAEVFGVHDSIAGAVGERKVGALASATFTVRRWLAFDVSGTAALSGAQPSVLQAGFVWNAGRLWRRSP